MSTIVPLETRLKERGGEGFWRAFIKFICTRLCPHGYECHELGQLIYGYIKRLAECFPKEKKFVSFKELDEIHRKYFGEDVYRIYYDRRYAIIDYETFIKFIEIDWVNYKKWKKDVFDCDDFARVLKAHIAEILEVNSCGYAVGAVYRDGVLVGYHGFNVIPLIKDGEVRFYLVEPQIDKVVEIKTGTNRVEVDGYTYEIYWIEY